MSEPIPLEEAWDRLLGMVEPLPNDEIEVAKADGRILAEPLIAARTQPYTDLSAMDGFACAGDGSWQLVGEARAGHAFENELKNAQAVRISTGSALPSGADRILVLEEAQIDGDTLHANEAPQAGRHIRRKGFDFEQGDELLPVGTRIGPRQIGLALSAGRDTLTVSRRPKVAILECGDELVADVARCAPDKLPASNGAMLASLFAQAGAEPTRIGPIGDDENALSAAIAAAADSGLLVTIGGASVGEHDHVKAALANTGADLAFWRVAIRPGKPLIVAKRAGQLVLGLPGNPASSFVTGYLFALPAIRAMLGASEPLPKPALVPSAKPLPPGGPRREFLRARLVGGHAEAIDERDSSALRALATADLLIDRPAYAHETKTGTPVPCYHLQNG